jgi:hypothetical protein
MSVEFLPTMMVRERFVWLTDNPGAMVKDFDRLPRLSNSCIASGTKLIWTAPRRRLSKS